MTVPNDTVKIEKFDSDALRTFLYLIFLLEKNITLNMNRNKQLILFEDEDCLTKETRRSCQNSF